MLYQVDVSYEYSFSKIFSIGKWGGGGGTLLEVARGCERMGYNMQEIDRKKVEKVGYSTIIRSH